MRVSLCVWLMMLPTLVSSGQVSRNKQAVPVWTPEQIDNAWIRENLKSLRRYAAIRERNAFSKEAMYSADKFRSRLSSSIENSRDYSVDEENIKPMYLRRKEERGKRM